MAVGSKSSAASPGSMDISRTLRVVIVVVVKIDIRIPSRSILMGSVFLRPDAPSHIPVRIARQNQVYMILVNIGISQTRYLKDWWKVFREQHLRVLGIIRSFFLNHR